MFLCSRTCIHTLLFFFNDTATTEIYTLSLHDALPICEQYADSLLPNTGFSKSFERLLSSQFIQSPNYGTRCSTRSEEHTSELQSRPHLVCRLLLEKKKKIIQGSECGRTIVVARQCRLC